MAVLYTPHFIQFFDNNGNPLSNGKLFAYSAGTTTPKATFTTEEGDIQNPHPIVLDSSGRATVFIDGSYRFDLFDQNNVLVRSTDDVKSFTTLTEAGNAFFQSFSGDGSQTVFTLSETLGTDSKNIMVFVNNEGGDVGFDIQNPSAYTISGVSLTFTTAPPNGTDNVYVFAPTKLLGEAAASAAAAASSEAAAASSAQAAAGSASSAAAAALTITSTTSVEIGTGEKTFTVIEDLNISAGQWLIISSNANPSTNYMTGQITSYSTTSLVVNITQAFGSGTLTDWTMFLSGVEGIQGIQGPAGALAPGAGIVVSNNDTNPDSLEVKLLSGGGITQTTQNDGGNETRTIAVSDVATATDGQVLTADGSGGAAFEDAAGEWVQIAEQTITAQSTYNVTGLTAAPHKLILENVTYATSGLLNLRIIDSADDTADSGASDYKFSGTLRRSGADNATERSAGNSAITIVRDALLANGPSSEVEVILVNPLDGTSKFTCFYSCVYEKSTGGEIEATDGVGMRDNASVSVSGVQILSGGGTFSGTLKVYRRK